MRWHKNSGDPDKMNTFLGELREITVLSVASTNPDNFETYGVVSEANTIEIDDQKYNLGNLASYSSEYIKPANEDIVYLINTNLVGLLSARNGDFFKKVDSSDISNKPNPAVPSVEK